MTRPRSRNPTAPCRARLPPAPKVRAAATRSSHPLSAGGKARPASKPPKNIRFFSSWLKRRLSCGKPLTAPAARRRSPQQVSPLQISHPIRSQRKRTTIRGSVAHIPNNPTPPSARKQFSRRSIVEGPSSTSDRHRRSAQPTRHPTQLSRHRANTAPLCMKITCLLQCPVNPALKMSDAGYSSGPTTTF